MRNISVAFEGREKYCDAIRRATYSLVKICVANCADGGGDVRILLRYASKIEAIWQSSPSWEAGKDVPALTDNQLRQVYDLLCAQDSSTYYELLIGVAGITPSLVLHWLDAWEAQGLVPRHQAFAKTIRQLILNAAKTALPAKQVSPPIKISSVAAQGLLDSASPEVKQKLLATPVRRLDI